MRDSDSMFLGKYCDSCRTAAAKVEVLLASGKSLLFCGHHASKHEAALKVQGAQFITESDYETEHETGTKIPVTNLD